jgi:hypothetical protein
VANARANSVSRVCIWAYHKEKHLQPIQEEAKSNEAPVLWLLLCVKVLQTTGKRMENLACIDHMSAMRGPLGVRPGKPDRKAGSVTNAPSRKLALETAGRGLQATSIEQQADSQWPKDNPIKVALLLLPKALLCFLPV